MVQFLSHRRPHPGGLRPPATRFGKHFTSDLFQCYQNDSLSTQQQASYGIYLELVRYIIGTLCEVLIILPTYELFALLIDR